MILFYIFVNMTSTARSVFILRHPPSKRLSKIWNLTEIVNSLKPAEIWECLEETAMQILLEKNTCNWAVDQNSQRLPKDCLHLILIYQLTWDFIYSLSYLGLYLLFYSLPVIMVLGPFWYIGGVPFLVRCANNFINNHKNICHNIPY